MDLKWQLHLNNILGTTVRVSMTSLVDGNHFDIIFSMFEGYGIELGGRQCWCGSIR